MSQRTIFASLFLSVACVWLDDNNEFENFDVRVFYHPKFLEANVTKFAVVK